MLSVQWGMSEVFSAQCMLDGEDCKFVYYVQFW
jgi:hypothetical protein